MTTAELEDEAAVQLEQPIPTRPLLLRRLHRAVKRRRRVWLVHNSGRFDRPSKLWRQGMARLRRKGTVITGTEAAGRSAAEFRLALHKSGWAYAHLTGAAEGECYAAWDQDVWQLIGHPFARKLTDMTWVRSKQYGGKRAAKVHALVVRLEHIRTGHRVWLVVWHAPLDNTQQRAKCWKDCAVGKHGLTVLVDSLEHRDPTALPIVVGDVNKNLREPVEAMQVHTFLEEPLRAVHSWRGGLPAWGGTHDRQVIDYAVLPRRALEDCELVPDFGDSDHRGFRYRVQLRAVA